MLQGFPKMSMESQRRRSALVIGVAVLIAVFACLRAAHAFEIAPFQTRNQSPLVRIYGLPAMGSALLTPQGHAEFQVMLDHSSHFVNQQTASERLTLDGETTRLTLGGRYGVARNVEIGVEIPFIHHGGGFLDDFLIGYHNLFGFPQGGRDQAPRNRLLYQYRRNGVDLLKVDSSGSGPGDISLTAGWQLYRDGNPSPRAVAIRASLKLPTGETVSLHGSGSTDISLGITASNAFALPIGQGAVFGAAGCMAINGGKILPEQQANHVVFGGIGAGWKPLPWIAFKVQMDAHTPFFRDSDLQALSHNAVVLQIGGTLGLTERSSLDIAVSEDLAVGTAPDVAFHFNFVTRF
jgi:hypothetical protein